MRSAPSDPDVSPATRIARVLAVAGALAHSDLPRSDAAERLARELSVDAVAVFKVSEGRLVPVVPLAEEHDLAPTLIAAASRAQRAQQPAQVRRALGVPAVKDGRTTSVVSLARSRGAAPGATEVEIVNAVAPAILLALERPPGHGGGHSPEEVAPFTRAAEHELRTPLSVINSYISMFLDGQFGPIPDGWSAALHSVAKRTAELSDAVENLLVATHPEAIEPQLQTVAVRNVITAALTRLRHQGALDGLDVTVHCGRVRCFADAVYMERIVSEVVLTCSERAGSTIEVVVHRDGKYVVIAVDGQSGLSGLAGAEDDPGAAAIAGRDLGAPGNGLVTAEHLAAMMGGEVRARSTGAGGRGYSVLLPAAGG